LIDPDSISQGTEVTIDETSSPPTIALNIAGNLSADGVTGQCLYSFLKEEWIGDATLPPYAFPMDAITPEQFVFLDDWEPDSDSVRKLLRTCGWAEKDASGTTKREYCGIISVPPSGVGSSDQPYYEHVASTPTDFTHDGAVNEAVQIYGDATHGDFDRRSTDINVFAREEQYTYSQASVFTNYGISSLSTGVYRVGLSTAADVKATVADTGIDANSDGTADVAPYASMVFQRHASTQSIAMAGGSYNFRWTLDCNGATIEQAYMYLAWLMRQDADIDAGAGTLNGKTAPQLATFVGDTLYTAQVASGEGFALTNFAASDINDVVFVDDTGAERTFPYTASLTIEFSAALQADPNAHYWVYLTSEFGTAASPLDDASSNPMDDDVGGSASASHTYDWTSNGDAAITVVAIGTTAKYYRTTGSILQSTENKVSLANAEDLVYANP
jgi:hypothetical protein